MDIKSSQALGCSSLQISLLYKSCVILLTACGVVGLTIWYSTWMRKVTILEQAQEFLLNQVPMLFSFHCLQTELECLTPCAMSTGEDLPHNLKFLTLSETPGEVEICNSQPSDCFSPTLLSQRQKSILCLSICY